MFTLTVPDNCKVEISRNNNGSWTAGIDQVAPAFPLSNFWFENEPMLIDEEQWEEENMHIDESFSMCIDESC